MVEEQKGEEGHIKPLSPVLVSANEFVSSDDIYMGDKVNNQNQQSENIKNKININVINNVNIHIEHGDVGVTDGGGGGGGGVVISKAVSDSIPNNATTTVLPLSAAKTPKTPEILTDFDGGFPGVTVNNQNNDNSNNNNNSANANNTVTVTSHVGFGTAHTFIEEDMWNDMLKKLEFFTKLQTEIWDLTCSDTLKHFKNNEKESNKSKNKSKCFKIKNNTTL